MSFQLHIVHLVRFIHKFVHKFFIVLQDIAYFDDPLHSTGALTTALGTHASAVQGV